MGSGALVKPLVISDIVSSCAKWCSWILEETFLFLSTLDLLNILIISIHLLTFMCHTTTDSLENHELKRLATLYTATSQWTVGKKMAYVLGCPRWSNPFQAALGFQDTKLPLYWLFPLLKTLAQKHCGCSSCYLVKLPSFLSLSAHQTQLALCVHNDLRLW